jgi:hypothetical protein
MYAKRWVKSGNSGYAPAAIMDWNAIRAAKPEDRKRAARKTRSLIPLTDQAVRDHLEGKSTIGVYSLPPDETCWFLAVDFDKSGWKQDALAYLATCRRFHAPAVVERSRSGNARRQRWQIRHSWQRGICNLLIPGPARGFESHPHRQPIGIQSLHALMAISGLTTRIHYFGRHLACRESNRVFIPAPFNRPFEPKIDRW